MYDGVWIWTRTYAMLVSPIIVTGKPPNMQNMCEEKCRRAWEKLILLSATLYRPCDAFNKDWPAKQEEQIPTCFGTDNDRYRLRSARFHL